MTLTTTTTLLARYEAADRRAGAAPTPLRRLTRVELRKLVDTRSGAWLLAAIGLATGAAVVAYLLAAGASRLTFANLVHVTVTPQSLLLPTLGIMAFTTEWTQRTSLVTHALVPARSRVIAAKLLAASILGLLAVGFAIALAAAANAAGSALLHGDGSWAYGVSGLRDTLLLQLLALLQGIALGMLFMNTAAAIAGSFALPTMFYLVFSQINALHHIAGWIDLGTSQIPLVDHTISGTGWLHLAATTLWWILFPLAAGMWRLLRREIK